MFMKNVNQTFDEAKYSQGKLQKIWLRLRRQRIRAFKNLDSFIDSLAEEEIDELNANQGGDDRPMPFELFCQKENIKNRK